MILALGQLNTSVCKVLTGKKKIAQLFSIKAFQVEIEMMSNYQKLSTGNKENNYQEIINT